MNHKVLIQAPLWKFNMQSCKLPSHKILEYADCVIVINVHQRMIDYKIFDLIIHWFSLSLIMIHSKMCLNRALTGERTVKRLRLTKALTVPDSTTISEACRRMAARKVDALLLTDSNALLCGILTDRVCYILLCLLYFGA